MGDSTHGPLLDDKTLYMANVPAEGTAGGPATHAASPLLPSQQRARSLIFRAVAAASRGPRRLRLCICGPPSAAADLVVYESLAAFHGVPLKILLGALRGSPSSAPASHRGSAAATAEALGAPAAAAKALRWLVRGSEVLTHIFCPALGTVERRSEARLVLQLLIDRAGNMGAAAASRKRTTAAATLPQQHQQQQVLRGRGPPQGPPAHTFVLEGIESLSSGQQRHLARLMDGAGVGWILICRAPHRLCPELRDQSCCLRFPRPSPLELGEYLYCRATRARATATAESSADSAEALPPIAYFVGLARAAGCEPLAALQLARRAAAGSFPALHLLCPDIHAQQHQQQKGDTEQTGDQEALERVPRLSSLGTEGGPSFIAGTSAVSPAGIPIRKLHRIVSRRPADPKTLQSLRSIWFEGLCGEHGGLSDQLDILLLLLRGRLCAERSGDKDYQAELTALLAARSAELREGFLAAGLQPMLDLLGMELLRLRDDRPVNKLKRRDSGSDPFEGEIEQIETDTCKAEEPAAASSEPQSVDGAASSREQLDNSSLVDSEERLLEARNQERAEPDDYSSQLFGPDE